MEEEGNQVQQQDVRGECKRVLGPLVTFWCRRDCVTSIIVWHCRVAHGNLSEKFKKISTISCIEALSYLEDRDIAKLELHLSAKT